MREHVFVIKNNIIINCYVSESSGFTMVYNHFDVFNC